MCKFSLKFLNKYSSNLRLLLHADGILILKRDLDTLEQVLTFKKTEILSSELVQRKKLKYKKN